MNFNDHSNLVGQHAFLSASNYHWTNYDDDKLVEVYRNSQEARRGSELHDFAANAIRLGIKLPRSAKTLNLHVNDAIGYRMVPEQVLFYSFNAFGTADAICFRGGILRIHDLKNGVTKTSMRQLEIYAALYCLEYRTRPEEIEIELRIYQNDEVLVHMPEAEQINKLMMLIVKFDKMIERMKGDV